MENRKNLCALIPESLHAKARTEQEKLELTLSQYVEMVLNEHFERGEKDNGKRNKDAGIPGIGGAIPEVKEAS